jgi:hypothetical protein
MIGLGIPVDIESELPESPVESDAVTVPLRVDDHTVLVEEEPPDARQISSPARSRHSGASQEINPGSHGSLSRFPHGGVNPAGIVFARVVLDIGMRRA